MIDRSTASHPDPFGSPIVSSSATRSVVVLEDGPARPSGVLTCSERLPRAVLVRLEALTRQVGALRQEHAAHPELSLRLDDVAADLDGLIQSIYDETVRHLAGRRG